VANQELQGEDAMRVYIKHSKGEFILACDNNDVRHAKQLDAATAFTRREDETLAIGARDEQRRRHSGAPMLRRYAATSLLFCSMACWRAVFPSLQRNE
jgi:hypothetical protein